MTTYPAQTAPKKRNPWLIVAIVLGAILTACLLGGVVASLGADSQKSNANGWGSDSVSPPAASAPAQSKAAAVTAPSASPSPAAVAVAQFGEGTYVVGKEMPAGRYTSTMTDNQYCYWERLKSDSGELDDVIANAVYMDKGKRSFTVKASDKFIQLKGDCVWNRG